jgi:hypothetical protein
MPSRPGGPANFGAHDRLERRDLARKPHDLGFAQRKLHAARHRGVRLT